MHITELTLQNHNLAAQRDFYQNTLGLNILEHNTQRLSIQAGSTRLTFEQIPPDHAGIYHFAFNIPNNQFAAACEWLEANHAILHTADGDRAIHFSRSSAVYFHDAEGNILEFNARHTLDNTSETPFSGCSILNISEIGIATEQVLDTVCEITEATGLKVRSGAGSETFTSVGDDKGMFIVVQQGRKWLPDLKHPAQALKTTITIAGLEHDHSLKGLPYEIRAGLPIQITPVTS